MQQPTITELSEKLLIGLSTEMSLANNKTQELWQNFIPKISEISNVISKDKISMQIYPSDYYKNFSMHQPFTKWAAVEVSTLEDIPKKLKAFKLTSGKYAVFNYRGSSKEAASFFQYIFYEWIPNSKYTIDNRPHFEVLGKNYKNEDPNSEEEIWIPIKLR